MSAPLRPSLLPQCTSCARRFTNSGLGAWPRFQQQVRGAKKKASNLPQTLSVRLLKDVKAYGRKGSFVPVPAGLMRNGWFPRYTAEYITPAELLQLKANDVTIERDYTFGMEEAEVKQEEARAEVLEIATPKPIEVEGISPQRSMELIEIFVPSRIDIAGTPRDTGKPKEKPREQPQPQLRGVSAADVLAAASAAPPKPVDSRIPIHGSVSTKDVAAFITQQLAVNEEAARVVVSERDVSFLDGTEPNDETKVRHLGEYEVEIKVKGSEGGVRRKLRVYAVERSSEVVHEVES
ncbi:Ribosomal protein L9/RNase H1 [Lasiodiplodia theobromae]|uniref:Ribosomal protein L9 domain-containing protein n=1 Tax=Lasiodiplodia theobromae TaxID=45133 RepID=A0A5N5DH13_9PEZI|nr:Ribosomal protein l9 RNAse h1 [Lasiodiplodia theobromae]KAB2577156.1 hypothetical protein DBV05_g4233 [Lasiodiplodia theobromae]KAF4543761.1 Ribosomal protein l9 RNAse h1 [Lasiodiplodia theobromae]KAF9631499.1 Ribosomal protein L9/RNase H1 [Lasiodiplodia theobromae]